MSIYSMLFDLQIYHILVLILLGLPSHYVQKSFREIAHFHAVSYHYMKTYPERVEEYYQGKKPTDGGFFTTFRKNKAFEMRHLANLSVAAKALFHNFTNKRLGEKLEEFQKKLATQAENEIPKGDFRVILHGDAWANNFMIR